MKTQGEIEAAVCEGLNRFEREYMGRGPKDIHTHLNRDLIVVRLHGVLVETGPVTLNVQESRSVGSIFSCGSRMASRTSWPGTY
jgi:uncharacterized protein YbcI